MNLSKSESLFLYSLLFQISSSDWDGSTKVQIENLMSSIEDFLTGGDIATCRPSLIESDDEDEDEDDSDTIEDLTKKPSDEKIVHHFLVAPADLQDLPPQGVKNSIGEKVTVQFEDVDFENSVDVLVNEGSILLPEISTIKLTDKTIEFHDGEDWEVFTYKRLSKAWANVFKLDYAYGLGEVE